MESPGGKAVYCGWVGGRAAVAALPLTRTRRRTRNKVTVRSNGATMNSIQRVIGMRKSSAIGRRTRVICQPALIDSIARFQT